jgi:hypothetical protein
VVKSKKHQTVYAFIDASNIIYGAKAEGWFIDQKKLFNYLKNKFKIKKAFFYYGKIQKTQRRKPFLENLGKLGLLCV